jgi:hypothetical protein
MLGKVLMMRIHMREMRKTTNNVRTARQTVQKLRLQGLDFNILF